MALREIEYYSVDDYLNAFGARDGVAKNYPGGIKPRKKVINLDFVVSIEDHSNGFVMANFGEGETSYELLYFKMSLGEVTRLLSP